MVGDELWILNVEFWIGEGGVIGDVSCGDGVEIWGTDSIGGVGEIGAGGVGE